MEKFNKIIFDNLNKLLNDKSLNYPISVILSILVFIILEIGFTISGMKEYIESETILKIFHLLILIISFFFFYQTSYLKIENQQRGEILFLGSQTGIFLEEGVWFLPFHKLNLFSIFTEGIVSRKRFNITMEPQEDTDSHGMKIKSGGKAIFVVSEDDEGANIFQTFDFEEIKENLISLTNSVRTEIIGAKNYYSDIRGKNISEEIKGNRRFQETCKIYGIECIILDPFFRPGNLDQEDLNMYISKLKTEIKSEYPDISRDKLEEMIQIRLKLSKKFYLDGDASDKARVVVE